MQAGDGLVAGSHNRNEFIVIRRDRGSDSASQQNLRGQICQICGDDLGVTLEGELFVACNECAFPICRTCYEYERREGSQVCPRCKTRFKRIKGCPRVDGDEEEDDIDDIDNEFDSQNGLDAEAMSSHASPQVPLLTNGQIVDGDVSCEQHALVPSLMGAGDGGGKRIYPLPFSDPSLQVQPRSLDPSKDLAAYGYGSIAWKERMENWKQKQEKLQMTKNENGGKDWDFDEDGPNLSL